MTALVLPVWPASVAVAVVALGLALGPAGTGLRTVARGLAAPVGFIALSAVAVAVTVEIDPSWSVRVSETSVLRAVEVAGRAMAGTLAVLLLAFTTPMTDVMSGLRRVGVPAACMEVASLMYGMLFILLDTTRTIRRSQAARLGSGSPVRAARSSGDLMALVLTRSWDQARRLERGLAGRGYVGELPTLDDPPRTSAAFMAMAVAALVAVITVSTGAQVLR